MESSYFEPETQTKNEYLNSGNAFAVPLSPIPSLGFDDLPEEVKKKFDDFKCPICLDSMIRATLAACHYGHKFCFHCINEWIKVNDLNRLRSRCPVCRDYIDATTNVALPDLDSEIAELFKSLSTNVKVERAAAIRERRKCEHEADPGNIALYLALASLDDEDDEWVDLNANINNITAISRFLRNHRIRVYTEGSNENEDLNEDTENDDEDSELREEIDFDQNQILLNRPSRATSEDLASERDHQLPQQSHQNPLQQPEQPTQVSNVSIPHGPLYQVVPQLLIPSVTVVPSWYISSVAWFPDPSISWTNYISNNEAPIAVAPNYPWYEYGVPIHNVPLNNFGGPTAAAVTISPPRFAPRLFATNYPQHSNSNQQPYYHYHGLSQRFEINSPAGFLQTVPTSTLRFNPPIMTATPQPHSFYPVSTNIPNQSNNPMMVRNSVSVPLSENVRRGSVQHQCNSMQANQTTNLASLNPAPAYLTRLPFHPLQQQWHNQTFINRQGPFYTNPSQPGTLTNSHQVPQNSSQNLGIVYDNSIVGQTLPAPSPALNGGRESIYPQNLAYLPVATPSVFENVPPATASESLTCQCPTDSHASWSRW